MKSPLKMNDYLMEFCHVQEDDIQYVPKYHLYMVLELHLLEDNMHKTKNKFKYYYKIYQVKY